MKKALLTTALVGSLVSGLSVANAATSVTGNLAIAYYATSNESATSVNTDKSYNGFGTESQINLAGSGDLNNGMKYAAGFSWEIDGTESLGGTGDSYKASKEGTYIEFINGGTTFGIMADRDTALDGLGVNFAGFGYRAIAGVGTSITNAGYNTKADFGFGIRQAIPGGTINAFYAPNTGDTTTQDIANGGSKTAVDNGEHYYSVTYIGKVAGADVKVGITNIAGVATYSDTEGKGIQIAYPIGKTKVGISRGVTTASVAAGSASVDVTTTEYGLGHALSDTLSASIAYTVTDKDGVVNDEKIVTAALGYNLGPVSLQVQYKDAQDIGGTAGLDAQQLGMYVSTKF